jgi:tetratricopeptide (TPR) repeat protein
MEVLVCLAGAAPETLTRQELLDKVWGERFVSDEVLTHAITELRHALGDAPNNPAYIETIPKRGYRLLKRPLPFEGPGADNAGNGRNRKMPEETARGGGTIRRNPGIALFILVGMVVILAAVLDLPSADKEVSSHTPRLGDSRAEPGQASNRTTISERLLQAESLEGRVTPDSSRQAELLLEQILSKEPNNAVAWSLLGRIYYRQTKIFRSRPAQEGLYLARQAIQRALDFDEANRHLRQAQYLSPADPYVLQVAARMEMTHAHVGHAIDLLEQSVSIDWNSCAAYADLGQAYYFANRLDDAENALNKSLMLSPDVVRSRYLLGLVRLARESMRPALVMMTEERDEGLRMSGIAILRYALNENQASDEAVDSLSRSSDGPSAYHMATVYAFRGQHDEALDWLELAYDHRDEEILNLLVDPALVGLRSEARWSRLVEKLDLPHRI